MASHLRRAAVTAFLLSVFGSATLLACTDILVTKGASKDGSTMITCAADSHTRYGQLYFLPAGDHPEGTFVDIRDHSSGAFLHKVKHVSHTYSVVGFTNEHQLSMRE